MIAKDLSHLPVAEPETIGEAPNRTPRFANLLLASTTPPDDTTAPSDAGKCSRAIGYRAAQIPRSNPVDSAGSWALSLDRSIRERWYVAMRSAYPDAWISPSGGVVVQTPRPLTTAEEADVFAHAPMDVVDMAMHDGLSHLDGAIEIDQRTLISLHTSGGFAYRMRVGERSDPEGPSVEHKIQAALDAVTVDADKMVIAYVSTEPIARPVAERKGISELGRFVAEWSYKRDEFGPWAEAEVKRVDGIRALVDQGQLPARKIPGGQLPKGAEIVDPATGRWEVHARTSTSNTQDSQMAVPETYVADTGTFYACTYCGWRDLCTVTKPGRIPVSDVVAKLGDAA